MLAVAPMDAGRPWGFLPAENSMMDTARAWIPQMSPTSLASERQTASPMAQSLPGGSRGSLAARRRQSLAPHRRAGSNISRGSGHWKAIGGSSSSGGSGGGGSMVQATSSAEGGERVGGGRRARAIAGVDSANGGESHPRSQDRASRDKGGGSRGDRTNGGQKGSNRISGSGGGGARGMVGCGEAWGVATTVGGARVSSDGIHSGASGFGRGGKSSNGPEVRVWAGTGGGAARGKAMLNAYGLQTNKHNPTCPRGTPEESVARNGRWQRSQDGGGARKVESGGGGAGNEGGGDSCRGSEFCAGAGQRRGSVRGARSGRAEDKSSDRVSAGRGHRFRGGKGRKHRSSTFSQDRSRVICKRCPSEEENATSGGQLAGDITAEGCDGGGRSAVQTSASAATPASGNHEGGGVLVKPGPRELAPQDLVVLPRGSTASPHSSGCSALRTTATMISGHLTTTLSMDGRGGSAAPPHRPSLTAAVSTSYAPALPDLTTAIETGPAAGGTGVIAAFEADSGCGATFREDSGGGDDHSTPPVSRQRCHSHHSPWQARKHPHGFPEGKVDRHHHTGYQGHPHEGSRGFEERPRSGSTTGRIGSNLSSESTEVMDPASSRSAGAWVAATPPATTFPKRKKPVDDGNGPPFASDPRESLGRLTSTGNAAPSSRPVAAEMQAEPTERLGVFGEAGRRECGDLDPFDRLLRAHHQRSHGSSFVVPQFELIDHFKLATRPTSRRGTRRPGSGEGGGGAGGDCIPEPAFCLFSRGVGGAGSARH
eukprot:g6984.t1